MGKELSATGLDDGARRPDAYVYARACEEGGESENESPMRPNHLSKNSTSSICCSIGVYSSTTADMRITQPLDHNI